MAAPSPLWMCVTSLILLCLKDSSPSYVQLSENGGYKDIVVAISPSISEEKGKDLILRLTEIFNRTSQLLYAATEKNKKARYIEEVVFLVPSTWEGIDNQGKRYWSYERADVRVIEDDDKSGIPSNYTEQPGKCGEPGAFIQLTLSFTTGSTDPNHLELQAQYVLQHWARYRYGVFPEEGDGSFLYPLQYIDENGAQVTGCMQPNPWQRTCSDKSNNECTFVRDDAVTVESSLMDNAMFQASFFCDKATHNPDAPTIHNNLCGRRSTWEILSEHEDFKQTGTISPPTFPLFSKEPAKIKARELAIALIIDSRLCDNAGSQITKAIPLSIGSTLSFVFPKQAEIGIIVANNGTTPMERIYARTEEAVNKWLQKCSDAVVSKNADEELSNAIEEGLKFLKSNFSLDKGGIIIVLANTQDAKKINIHLHNYHNKIKDQPVTDNYFISYSESAPSDKDLAEIRNYMKQIMWYDIRVSKEEDSGCLKARKDTHEALTDIVSHYGMDFQQRNMMVLSEILQGSAEKTIMLQAMSDVTFTFQYCDTKVDLWIDKDQVTEPPHPLIKTIIKLAKREAGELAVKVLNGAAYVSIDVFPSDSSTLSFTAYVKESKETDGPSIVQARVRRGNASVKNAIVSAILISSKGEEKFPLQDSGNGDPDLFLNDGIYSHYVMPKESGMYKVLVQFDGIPADDNKIISYSGFSNSDGSPIPLNRNIGSFYFNAVDDSYPPNQILDLQVTSNNQESGAIHFEWTAPGRNFDQGTADKYEFKCSISSETVRDNDAFNRHQFEAEGLPDEAPKQAGTKETMQWIVPYDSRYNDKLLYCAIRAQAGSYTNHPSNVVAVNIFTLAPISTTPEVTVDVASSTTNSTEEAIIAPVTENQVLDTLEVTRDAVIGGTVTIILLLLILIGLLIFFMWRRNVFRRKPSETKTNFRLSKPSSPSTNMQPADNPAYTPEPHREPDMPKDRYKPPSRDVPAMLAQRALPNTPSPSAPQQTTSLSEVKPHFQKGPNRGPSNMAGPRTSHHRASAVGTEETPQQHYMNMDERPNGPSGRGLQVHQAVEEALYDDVNEC